MMELKKQITKIIVDGVQEYRPAGKPVEEITEKILDTVTKAGYVGRPPAMQIQTSHSFQLAREMTGQEWYDRYDQEVKRLIEGARSKENLLSVGGIHRMAARRAAGLAE